MTQDGVFGTAGGSRSATGVSQDFISFAGMTYVPLFGPIRVIPVFNLLAR